MPLSYYKRILFIALLFYIFLIILYKAAVPGGNPFSSGSNIDLKLPLKRAEIEGIITSYPRSFGK
ncbi:MAG: hypothetical protein U9Q34_06840, partial [Elusimicrobiota bacterium]|nr:hypothetical protein [Elusimicrobiota bacterium]